MKLSDRPSFTKATPPRLGLGSTRYRVPDVALTCNWKSNDSFDSFHIVAVRECEDGQPSVYYTPLYAPLALRARAIMTVNLSLAPHDGAIFWLATGDEGVVTRLDAAGI